MVFSFLNKLPIPNLKHYCLFSFSLLTLVLIYSLKLFNDIRLNHENQPKNQKKPDENLVEFLKNSFIYQEDKPENDHPKEESYLMSTYDAISREPWCIWVLVNFCYCCLLLFSKVIQGVIFGKLRAIENQHIKDQFWNFIFLKFIFIFGVLNLDNLNQITMWCAWFSLLGFLSIHCQICKDRFEYLSFSTSTPIRIHAKIIGLLVFIETICIGLIYVSYLTQKTMGISIGLFAFADSIGLALRTLYVISRYGIHLVDSFNLAHFINKGTFVYYVDFSFEVVVIAIDFLHYMHMLIYGNFYLSMASLVICMELKRLFFDLKRRIRRHSNYLKVIDKMERRFPWATQEELDLTDKCAVCWENLEKARRLPCSHVFHHHCLRSWLEQDTSCPTCRRSLQDEKEMSQRSLNLNNFMNNANNNNANNNNLNNNQNNANNINNNNNNNNENQRRYVHRNLFHFNGSRYSRWLPNFSLEVTNNAAAFLPNLLNRENLTTERLNEMTQQVSQLFPHIPINLIQQDLNQTHSVEITIENILENRLNPLANSSLNINNLMNNNAVNTNVGSLLLNSSDESDDLSNDDDDEDEDESVADENGDYQSSSGQEVNPNSNNSTNRTDNLLGNNSNEQVSSTSNSSLSSTLRNRQQSSSLLLNDDETNTNSQNDAIISKYSPSTNLSENANNLMIKKRDLILNSKKRYLEKLSSNENSKKSQ